MYDAFSQREEAHLVTPISLLNISHYISQTSWSKSGNVITYVRLIAKKAMNNNCSTDLKQTRTVVIRYITKLGFSWLT